MTRGEGSAPPASAEKPLGDIVNEVSQKASLLVREEIELAKAELQVKASRLGKGAGVGAATGALALFALIFFLHALAWFFTEVFGLPTWVGYLIVTVLLLVIGAVAGFVALRLVRGGTPPTPELAIEEARRTRGVLQEARR